ncbi:MAG: NAD(P)/FAD-dependent oxidoreductase [Candidatus Wildermuthbacteria bacterium]|nr:NAD(P)/FAD-dependent oxidoreductase [Candidatus Wildermuthbacteria bacterium]
MSQNNFFDVIVVGGGASGMMAAGRAGERGKRVLLLEKNRELGKKLKITGGGRCNITSAEFNAKELLARYGKAEPFLHSPFSQFGVKNTFSFFESKGLPLVVQENKRAFPKTEKALDVFRALERYLSKNHIAIQTGARVSQILTKDKTVSGVLANGKEYGCSSVILASGGMSHPETGSTGDGFAMLKNLGHSVQTPTPSIVPLTVQDPWVKRLAGISLPLARISFFLNGKKIFSKTGEILFTHFGLSGPCVLNSAQKVGDMLHEGEVTAAIDPYPNVSWQTLEKQILNAFQTNPNKTVVNALKKILPQGTARVFSFLVQGVTGKEKSNSVTREQRDRIAHALKNLTATVTGLMGLDKAVVVDGGVDLKEIDTKTMQSKLCANLFVTGDLLHINRPSGGYSLQLCWTTGYVAGNNA